MMVCIFVLIFGSTVYSAQMLDFEEVTDRAVKNAYEVKISGIDVAISKAAKKKAYSLYYPTLNARWNYEYVKDLTDGTAQITSVGNTVFGENTMYQNYFSIAAQYNLFDFGSTNNKVLIAKKEVDVKKNVLSQSIRDIRLKVLNLYTDLLLNYKELESKKELLTLYKELSLTKERLHAAGLISRIEMVDDTMKVVKIIDAIDNLKLKFTSLLGDLSFYTGEGYQSEGLRVSDLKGKDDYDGGFDPERSPESRIYELEIQKKKAELAILQNDRLPQFGLYSSYVWYASDRSEIDNPFLYTKPRNYFVGISATLPLFEGFKTNADIEKAKLEIDRLKVEKGKKLAELTARHAKLNEAKKTYTNGIENQKDMLDKTEAKLTMTERLTEQKVIEWAELLKQKIELVNQRYELARAIIQRVSAVKELQILSGVSP